MTAPGSALVVGTGRMARLRVPALRASGLQVTLTGRDADRTAAAATALSADVVSYEQAASSRYDCVVVSSASGDHPADLRAFLPTAPVVLCEKPVAISPAEIVALRPAVLASGAELFAGFQRRFDAGIAGLRERVAGGEVGDLLQLRATDFDRRPGSREFITTSGGMFRDLVIHDLDWLMWTTGLPVRSVYAAGSALVSDDYRDLGDCDIAVVTVVLGDGTLATISASRAHPLGQDVRVEIVGTLGALSAGLTPATPLNPVEATGGHGPVDPPQTFMDRFADAFRRETDQFARYVTGRSPSFDGCTFAEATTASIVAEACDASWRSGRPVVLTDTVPAVVPPPRGAYPH